MRGSHVLFSKACKRSARARQNEEKVPFKEILPLKLRNRVSGKSDSNKGKMSQEGPRKPSENLITTLKNINASIQYILKEKNVLFTQTEFKQFLKW